jgi:hypothetical protein
MQGEKYFYKAFSVFFTCMKVADKSVRNKFIKGKQL